MKKLYLLFTLFFISSIALNAVTNPTPQQILANVINKISTSKGIESKFTVTNSGYSSKGEILTSGNKFKVTLPEVEIWYNGKDLYTYNKNTDEVTIVNPTAEELQEANPLAYVTGAANNYNVTFSTVKKNGSDVLELTPKKNSNEIKRLTLTVRKSDYIPERIVVEPKSGSPIRADITSFKTGVNINSTIFEFPKSKYPKVEVVDLR